VSNTFKPGDRVVYVGRHPIYFSTPRMGQHGTVMKDLIDSDVVAVNFDGVDGAYIVFLENVELLQSLTQAHLNAREEQISQLHQQLDNADVRINSLQSEIKTLKDRIQLVSRVSIKRYMLIGKLQADAAINEGYTEILAKRLVNARNHLERVRSAINTYEPDDNGPSLDP
jgi:hypothetical protein